MSSLPSYLAAAKPVPAASRAPWYKTVMPTYIGIMLWFVFWQSLANAGVSEHGHPAGVLAYGFSTAFLGLIIAAMICHFLFYLGPALLGMRTGLPLYVVGTSTYGASGGRYMPGFLMGLLQFGWLAVNGWAVSEILCRCFGAGCTPTPHGRRDRARHLARRHCRRVHRRCRVRGTQRHSVRGPRGNLSAPDPGDRAVGSAGDYRR